MLGLALWGWWSGGAVAAVTAAGDDPGLEVRSCGAVTPDVVSGAGLLPARLVRPGDRLAPGDRGLGCRVAVKGTPDGGSAVVEVRLSRPGLAGNVVRDRWFVAVRPGTDTLAAHLFDAPIAAGDGPWTVDFLRDGRQVASRRFTVAASPAEAASPVAGAAEDPVVEVVAPQAPPAAASRKPPAPTASPAPAARPTAAAPQTAPARTAAKPAVPSAKGYYAWQTGLFADAANAEKQAAALRAGGLPACVATEKTAAGRRYRVLAGRYGDRTVARARRGNVVRVVRDGPVLYHVEPAMIGRLRCH